MVDPDDDGAPALDLPDSEQVWRNYLENCRRLGVVPVSRERATDLMREWGDAIATGRAAPPVRH